MSNLIIVGNGFDLAHEIETSYIHFKEYLEKEICKVDPTFPLMMDLRRVPELPPNHIYHGFGDTSYLFADYYSEAKALYWLLSRKLGDQKDGWAQFEARLGQLDWDAFIEEYGDDRIARNVLDSMASDLSGFFFRWINTISLESNKFSDSLNKLLLDKNTLVLSFNYTETIEYIYGFDSERILHIHGKRESDTELSKKKDMTSIGENGCQLIVGYNIKEFERKYSRRLFSSRAVKSIYSIDLSLVKDTSEIIQQNSSFWEKLRNTDIDSIYSVGFSFSKVDEPYIRKICEVLNSKPNQSIKWYLNKYNYCIEGLYERFSHTMRIRKSGFKGSFGDWKLF